MKVAFSNHLLPLYQPLIDHWWCIHYMMMSWHGDSFHFSPSETGGMPSQNDISLVLACIICWTNSQVAIDYKCNKNTLGTCKNPRPTSGWSELTKSCTTSTMNFHMAYFSWSPQNNARLKLSCKFGESKCNPYSWVQSGGPVTTESIIRFDTWFELFEVFRKNVAPMTLAKMAAEFVRSQNPKWPPVAILEM